MRFIGCKTLLLENIEEVIKAKAPNAKIICDIFSGTATVARYLSENYTVYSNDLLYFSYILQRGTVGLTSLPTFDKLFELYGIKDPIRYLNSLEIKEMEILEQDRRFFQNNYAPTGGRMYVNDENALRIDYARNKVQEWYDNKVITEDEYYYLVACIVEGVPFVSNTSGTYGAFHKEWERRSFKKYELYRLEIENINVNNKCFNEDGVELLKNIEGDVLYVDPPYNSRQYLPNYHVLETAAKYDYPEIRGVTGQRPYENNKSDFCLKTKVKLAFEQLINNAKFNHIILSYSTDGLMSLEEIESIMKKYGKPETFIVYKIPYRRYKSRAQIEKEELKELIIYIEK